METTEATLAAADTETRRRKTILQEHGASTWKGVSTEVAREDFERIGYEIPIREAIQTPERRYQLRRLIAQEEKCNFYLDLTGDLK